MKKTFMVLAIFVVITSFTSINYHNTNMIKAAIPVTGYTIEGWGPWNYMNCFPELAYRVRRDGSLSSKTGWMVQFRNDYDQTINFNFFITEPGNKSAFINYDGTPKSLPYRQSLRPEQLSSENIFIININSYENCLVLVAQVRFGNNTGPYETCE